MNGSRMELQVPEKMGDEISITFQCFHYMDMLDTLGFWEEFTVKSDQ